MCVTSPSLPPPTAQVVNHDPDTKDYLRVYFLPDYNVTLAETIIPGPAARPPLLFCGMRAPRALGYRVTVLH